MLGGVSGHAGLFSDAEDLAILMQMLMNGGEYGGKEYIDPDLLKTFTTRFGKSTRRGVGFDMKELNPERTLLTSHMASEATYGHTGFTGICVWNRTYPTMRNPKLTNNKIREKIHSRAYRAIQGYDRFTLEPLPG